MPLGPQLWQLQIVLDNFADLGQFRNLGSCISVSEDTRCPHERGQLIHTFIHSHCLSEEATP